MSAADRAVAWRSQANETFPIDEARRAVADLMAPRPLVYWADFLFHIALGWGAFVLCLRLPPLSPGQLFTWVVASLALYRSVLFIHELAHRKPGTFGAFRLVWNLSCGFPLMVPSFLYKRVHNDHHAMRIFGTRADGEYLPFGTRSPRHIVFYLLLIFVLPFVFPLRFIALAPLSTLHPRLRELVWSHFSSLTIDFTYRRPPPATRDRRSWRLEELGAFLYGAIFVALIGAGILPFRVVILWYCTVVLVFLLNSLRTLAAHRYRNPGDRLMELAEQFLDSVDIPGNRFITPLWAPLGLRYHATHHLFPTMPYHSLGEAYRRLARELPTDGPYLRATRASLGDALASLWREARAASS
jgi:fatty acid desaturase